MAAVVAGLCAAATQRPALAQTPRANPTPEDALTALNAQPQSPESITAVAAITRLQALKAEPHVAIFKADATIPGRWNPTQADADAVLVALAAYAHAQDIPGAVSSVRLPPAAPGGILKVEMLGGSFDPRNYVIQLAGIGAGAGGPPKQVAINGYTLDRLAQDTSERWRTEWSTYSEERSRSFAAVYDPASREIVSFQMNRAAPLPAGIPLRPAGNLARQSITMTLTDAVDWITVNHPADTAIDILDELNDLKAQENRVVVFDAAGAGGWKPTREEAMKAWSALKAYGPAQSALASGGSMIQVVRGPPTRFVGFVGPDNWIVQVAGAQDAASAGARRTMSLNVVSVAAAVGAGDPRNSPWAARKLAYQTRPVGQGPDMPPHLTATYDPASDRIIGYNVLCGNCPGPGRGG